MYFHVISIQFIYDPDASIADVLPTCTHGSKCLTLHLKFVKSSYITTIAYKSPETNAARWWSLSNASLLSLLCGYKQDLSFKAVAFWSVASLHVSTPDS